MRPTAQMQIWAGEFGKKYTDRNLASLKELYSQNIELHGRTNLAIYQEALKNVDKDARVLEIGCNIGNQLMCLQDAGFKNLYGIELQWYAVDKSKYFTKKIHIIQGSAFDIPCRDSYFDLVYTYGVLIHISPKDLPKVLSEAHRCSKKYIMGFEYHDQELKQLKYRGNNNLMWKTDYSEAYQNHHPDLKEVFGKEYPQFSEPSNVDRIFLLAKEDK